jgi:hypothetical protein
VADDRLEEALQARLDALLDRGSQEGKIPPAQRNRWAREIMATGDGKLTVEALAWGEKRLDEMEPLVTVVGKEHRPPSPFAGMMDGLTPANWEVWAEVDRCELWEAVVLTVDHEPTGFVIQPLSTGGLAIVPRSTMNVLPADMVIGEMPRDLMMKMHGRLKIALSNLDRSLKPLHALRTELDVQAGMSLPVFGTWAATKWSDLPEKFPRLASVAPKPTDETPSGGMRATKTTDSLATKERTNLLVIIGALAYKAGIDLTRTTVAAKEIERVVREDLKSKISVRTVEEHLKRVPDALDRKAPDSED